MSDGSDQREAARQHCSFNIIYIVVFVGASGSTQAHALLDEQFLPRYLSSVWSLLHAGSLAASTHKRKLSVIEALYVHTEALGGNLDDALSALDFDALGNALGAEFISLRNASEPSPQAEARWNQALQFVRNTCDRIARNPAAGNRMVTVRSQVEHLAFPRAASAQKAHEGVRASTTDKHSNSALPRRPPAEALDGRSPLSYLRPDFEAVLDAARVDHFLTAG
ncbi:MAG: hypothetical protein JO006_19615 [Paucibacter sp.]|nr:hypothetical protein [Roseateles sp.]